MLYTAVREVVKEADRVSGRQTARFKIERIIDLHNDATMGGIIVVP